LSHLGNFPQAFTHLAVINAVAHPIRVDQRLRGRGALAGRTGLTVGSVETVRAT
jgi:hypothetical protein